MYSIECKAGRLVEVRMAFPIGQTDAEAVPGQLQSSVSSLSESAVVCLDLRALRTFPPPVAEVLPVMVRARHEKLERSALLLRPNTVVSAQIERMVADAGNAATRAFSSEDELKAWLGECLSADEKARLDAFLGEYRSDSAAPSAR